MMIGILLESMSIGLTSCVETLVSQAYGYGNLTLCGVLFNRGRIILILFFIPLAILLSYSDSILSALS